MNGCTWLFLCKCWWFFALEFTRACASHIFSECKSCIFRKSVGRAYMGTNASYRRITLHLHVRLYTVCTALQAPESNRRSHYTYNMPIKALCEWTPRELQHVILKSATVPSGMTTPSRVLQQVVGVWADTLSCQFLSPPTACQTCSTELRRHFRAVPLALCYRSNRQRNIIHCRQLREKLGPRTHSTRCGTRAQCQLCPWIDSFTNRKLGRADTT